VQKKSLVSDAVFAERERFRCRTTGLIEQQRIFKRAARKKPFSETGQERHIEAAAATFLD
jgi:hypothetical protein